MTQQEHDAGRDINILEEGEGRCRLHARLIPMGDHLLVTLSGGKAHIGAVSLAEPNSPGNHSVSKSASVSTLTRTNHKEDVIARNTASNISSHLGIPVLVCCGIHLDEITVDEIEDINRNAMRLQEKIIESIRMSI
jgi:gallate decarboxylase subunit D